MLTKVKKLFKVLGPGIITGASDDDPSGIATYSQAGASMGFGALWTALFSFPLMAAVQEIAARVGLVTGHGLTGNLKRHYPRWLLLMMAILVFGANTINIGADIAGMSAAANLVLPLPSLVYVLLFSAVVLAAMIYLPYHKFAGILKWLTLALLSYLAVPFVIGINWGEALRQTIIPQISWNKDVIMILVAVFGTTVSPYLFFWQADMEIEDEIDKGKNLGHWIVTKHEVRLMEEDTTIGMLLSNVVTWFIIAATGATLFAGGINNITTAAQAASALKPIAGDGAQLLFALGLIGVGLMAIPVLAGSASYVIAETFGLQEGLEKSFHRAKRFYLVIILSTIIGAALSLSGLDPIKLLFYTAIIFGLISPPLILILLLIGNNRAVMGDRVNGKLSNSLAGVALLVMTVAAGAFVYLSFTG